MGSELREIQNLNCHILNECFVCFAWIFLRRVWHYFLSLSESSLSTAARPQQQKEVGGKSIIVLLYNTSFVVRPTLFMTLCLTHTSEQRCTAGSRSVGCVGLLELHITGTLPRWFITCKHFNAHEWPKPISKAGCMWAALGCEISSTHSWRLFRGRALSHSITQQAARRYSHTQRSKHVHNHSLAAALHGYPTLVVHYTHF